MISHVRSGRPRERGNQYAAAELGRRSQKFWLGGIRHNPSKNMQDQFIGRYNKRS
jgi:hypothetical protein